MNREIEAEVSTNLRGGANPLVAKHLRVIH